jgi:antitoxin YokJ
MTVESFLRRVKEADDCRILPPTTEFRLPERASVLTDMVDFYQQCDGIEMFTSQAYTYRIFNLKEIGDLNREIHGECICGDTVISDSWIFIAEDNNGEQIAIDTELKRAGRVYDLSFGNDYQIIALSFLDLVEQLFDNRGGYPYWLEESFKTLGDACDY